MASPDFPRALVMDTISMGDSNISLLSCDHIPARMPSEDPWGVIEENISSSSVVFTEYFPPELERTIFRNRVQGSKARALAESNGINSFFGKVTSLAAKYDKEVAVADPANRLLFAMYHIPIRIGISSGTFVAGFSLGVNISGILGGIVGEAGLLFFMTELGLFITSDMEMGLASLQMHRFERYILDIVDSRRVETARGIKEAALNRERESNILYIAPHAHVSRVKWYLENANNPFVKAKEFLYSLLPGLDHSTRYYKYQSDDQTWQPIQAK